MSATDKLKEWMDPVHWDNEPTEEQALRQFLYMAISDFVDHGDGKLATDAGWGGSDEWSLEIDQWLEAWCENKPEALAPSVSEE